MAKPARRDLSKEKFWRSLLRAWRRSGLSGRAFCAEHELSEPSFYAWRREIVRRDRERQAGTERTPRPARSSAATTPSPATSSTFTRVTLDSVREPASASAIEVVVAERRVLRVRPGFDADVLRQLVRLLEEPAC
jgi:hypothetical protein